MKGTDHFKETIEEHLKFRAYKFPLFKKAMGNPKKNIDDCITYILNAVQKSGQNGFTDDEVFSMAAHYYDEEVIDIGKKMTSANVVVNHTVRLTEKEIAEAKQKALDDVINEERNRLTQKPKVSKDKSLETSSGNTLF